MPKQNFIKLVEQIKQCQLCEHDLPVAPRPVVQVHPQAKILIAGQAPGIRVHHSGIPFDDASGDRLRFWLGLERDIFYDATQVAIVPMGFCYPGRGRAGDLPPRKECAPAWRQKLLDTLPNIRLTLAIGVYAQQWHLPIKHKTLTETVKAWESYGPELVPLPHPSPRNNIWLKRNPWFNDKLIPSLRLRVQAVFA